MPGWILAASYSLHLLATVLWVGGLVFQALFLLPLLAKQVPESNGLRTLTLLQNRFQPLAWLCLAVLFGTGLTQMTAHPQYLGLLALQNSWSIAIFAKHVSILPMVGITVFQSFVLHPKLQRELLRSARPTSGSSTLTALRSEQRMVVFNTLLSLVVLILTALARTS